MPSWWLNWRYSKIFGRHGAKLSYFGLGSLKADSRNLVCFSRSIEYRAGILAWNERTRNRSRMAIGLAERFRRFFFPNSKRGE